MQLPFFIAVKIIQPPSLSLHFKHTLKTVSPANTWPVLNEENRHQNNFLNWQLL